MNRKGDNVFRAMEGPEVSFTTGVSGPSNHPESRPLNSMVERMGSSTTVAGSQGTSSPSPGGALTPGPTDLNWPDINSPSPDTREDLIAELVPDWEHC